MNRSFFPSIDKSIFFENSGGTQPPIQVIESLNKFIKNSYLQPGGYSTKSISVTEMLNESQNFLNMLINNKKGKIVLGNSASQICLNVSNSYNFKKNDEIILSSFSHESSIGPFTRVDGVKCYYWNLTKDSKLDTDQLLSMINNNTKLLVIPHVSNLLGNVYDIKTIVNLVKKKNNNVKIYVDGVAYLAHKLIDVDDLNVDFYVISLYKFLGLRISMLYIKSDIISTMKNINHYFISDPVNRLQLGGVCYELCSSILGIRKYFCDWLNKDNLSRTDIVKIYSDIRIHEKNLISYFDNKFNNLLNSNLKLLTDKDNERVPIFSIYSDTIDIEIITLFLNQNGIECKSGNFYSKRILDIHCISSVLRISLCHYNSLQELDKLFDLLCQFTPFKSKLVDYKLVHTPLSENVKKSFDNLVLDKYYKNERYKRFSLVDIEKFLVVGSSIFMQNKKYNQFLGNIPRKYHNIDSTLLNDESFRSLLKTFSIYINANENKCKYVYIHQIRVNIYPNQKIDAVPEGIHQDGYQYICICSVFQQNIICPYNEIYNYEKKLIESILLKPHNSLIMNDKKYFHNVTPINNDDQLNLGYRDIFVITTIK